MDVANRVMVEAWNTVLYEKFCRFRHLIVEGVSQHSNAALRSLPVSGWFACP